MLKVTDLRRHLDIVDIPDEMTYRVYGDGVVAKLLKRNSRWKSVVYIHHNNDKLEINRKRDISKEIELALV